jgi:hypothetical protein
MRRIVPRESRDLNEPCNKILRFAQDDLLPQVRFLLAVEMTDSPNTTFYEVIIFEAVKTKDLIAIIISNQLLLMASMSSRRR